MALGGPMMNPQAFLANNSIELIYAAIIIAICAIIYLKTKEIYDLSGHQGIKYFRHTFLFFALAYVLSFVPILFRLADIHLRGFRIMFILGFLFFGYASSMAILSMVRSVAWKKLKGIWKHSGVYYLIALIGPACFVIYQSRSLFFVAQSVLLIVALITIFVTHKQSQKKTSVSFYTYILLLFFWILNVFALSIPKFMTTEKLFIYALSIIVFIIILTRTLQKMKV